MNKTRPKANLRWTAEDICIAAAVLLIILRQALTAGLPLYIRESYFDDQLMLRMTEGLISGEWLGPYDSGTLMKGAFYPLSVACIHVAGISYLVALTAFHSAACVFFTSQVRFLFRRRFLLLILLAVLLFNPGSFAWQSFQVLYRNTLSVSQVLIVFGAIYGLWLDYGKYRWKDVVRTLIAGAMTWAFWNTREDAIWILPFLMVGLLLVVGKAGAEFLQNKKIGRLIAGVAIGVIPFLILHAGNGWIKYQNEKYYGVPIRLEAENGAFAEALKAIYSVKNDEVISYVSVSSEKLERLYQASPTLNSIRETLDEKLAFYSGIGRHPKQGETEDGWFLWALRIGAYDAGKAASLTDAQTFYGRIAAEIEDALDEGILERQSTMPSALMSPWRKGYAKEMLRTYPYAVKSLLSFDGTESKPSNEREYGKKTIQRYESVSNTQTVLFGDTSSGASVKGKATAFWVNRIAKVYQIVTPVAGSFALGIFIAILTISLRKKKNGNILYLLVTTGMGLSVMLMLTGIVYTEITAFSAIRHTYLAGAYPLTLACIVITILYGGEQLYGNKFRSSIRKIIS